MHKIIPRKSVIFAGFFPLFIFSWMPILPITAILILSIESLTSIYRFASRLVVDKRHLRFFIYWIIPITYWISNLVLTNGIDQIFVFNFFLHDGEMFAIWIVLFMLFLSHSRFKENLEKNIKMAIYASTGMLFLALIFYSPDDQYYLAFFSSHNASAGFIGGLLLVILYMEIKRKRLFFGRAMIVLPIIGILFILAKSRAFLLGFFVSLIFLLLAERIIRFRRISRRGLVIIFSTFMIIVLALYGMKDRFLGLEQDYNVVTRFEYWALAIEMFLDSPVMGVGIGNYNDVSIPIFSVPGEEIFEVNGKIYGDRHAHNIVLQILSEQGVIGVLIFFLSLYQLTFSKYISHEWKNLIRAQFIYLIVASMFGLNLFTPSTSLWYYFLLAGVWAGVSSNYRNNSDVG